MYAVIKSGGKQYRVESGAKLRVESLAADVGAAVSFDQVLLVEKDAGEILAGAPFVANAKVLGVVDGEARGPKLRVFKKKRRKGFRKTRGHRSIFTRVRITDIQV